MVPAMVPHVTKVALLLFPYLCPRRRTSRTGNGASGGFIPFGFTRTMNGIFFKVARLGEQFAVQSPKSESGQIMKRIAVLRELGGKYADEYAVAMLGEVAEQSLAEGDTVAAKLRFQTREYNGQVFQDILATEVVKL